MHASAVDLHGMLKEGGRGSAGDRGGQGLRRMLVVAEVALALTLLTGAGLLVKSFARLAGRGPRVRPGPRPDLQPGAAAGALPIGHPADRLLRPGAAGARRPRPGVRSVGSTSVVPFGGNWSTSSFEVEGYQPPRGTAGAVGGHPDREPGLLRRAPDPAPARARAQRAGPGPARPRSRWWTRSWPTATGPTPIRSASGSPTARRRASPTLRPGNGSRWSASWATPSTRGSTPRTGCRSICPTPSAAMPFLTAVLRTAADPSRYANQARRAVQSIDPDLPIANRAHDGRADRAVGRSAPALDAAPQRVLGDRAGARVDRDLRLDELLRGAALARARRPHRAGRGAGGRVATRPAAGDAAGADGDRGRGRDGVRPDPGDREPALRGQGDRPRHLRRRRRAARGHGPRRQSRPGAARHPGGSGGECCATNDPRSTFKPIRVTSGRNRPTRPDFAHPAPKPGRTS